jgi:mediator of RNA polymerase II transcription subunit 5
LIVRHRFELQDYDQSNDQSDSFVRKYMKNACVSRSPESLTEHENKLLGGWIRGLFETEGISDELMSMCSPKEFHLLVATLFDQSLKACQAKFLALDTLKGGFECR